MVEEKKEYESLTGDMPRVDESPGEGVQIETTFPSPETAGISEEERQNIIDEERSRIQEEHKMKEEAVKAYKKEHKKGFGLFKGLILLIVIIGVVAAVGYLTFDAFGNQNAWGNSYPYVATYDVLMPDSSEVLFGNVHVLAVSSGNEVTMKIGNERQILSIGTPVEFQPAHMTVKMYGLTLRESDYHLTVTYRGLVENHLDFLVSARTSESPMSSWMRGLVVPSQALVRPV